MTNNQAIEKAINGLKNQERPNVAKTAREYSINQKTLDSRWNGKSVLIKKAVSTF